MVAGYSSDLPARHSKWLLNALLSSSLLLLSVLGLALLGAGSHTGWVAQAPRAIAVPPQPRGFLRKAGPVPSLLRLAAISPQADRIAIAEVDEVKLPNAWQAARLAAMQNGTASPPPLPPWCTFMLNDEYKLIFVKCVLQT